MAEREVKEDASNIDWSIKSEFNNIAFKSPMHGINWQNDSGIVLPSNYRLVHFDTNDITLLRDVYQIMNPEHKFETKNLS